MSEHTPRSLALRDLIGDFIFKRQITQTAFEKLPEDDSERLNLRSQVNVNEWLAKAVKDLQAQKKNPLRLATHPIKSIHSAAEGSSLCVSFDSLPSRDEIGSHCLKNSDTDAVGNAAVLGVLSFLTLKVEDNESILSLLQKSDADLLMAFGVEESLAFEWRDEFCKVSSQDPIPRSHALAKQIYWPVMPLKSRSRPTVHDDNNFHLLSVLHSSPMAHCLYGQIQTDRFGEEAKAARQARRDGVQHPHGYHDYPLLAEEKKGGTKPQNISQLNSERKGSNYLLASLPPQWENSGARPLYGVKSLFDRFGQLREVRRLLRELREFLGKLKPEQNNMHIRNQRDAYLEAIFSEFVQFGAGFYNTLPAGWTADPECVLPIEEQCWLDPSRAEEDADFNKVFQLQNWPEALATHFSFWFNRALGHKKLSQINLELGEQEFEFWKRKLTHYFGWRTELDNALRQQGSRLLPSGSSTGDSA